MSTSGRPTFAPAMGHVNQGGWRKTIPTQQISARNQPGHTKLKVRQPGQGTKDDIAKKDLKLELELKEKKVKPEGVPKIDDEEPKLLKQTEEQEEQQPDEDVASPAEITKNIDADDTDSSEDEKSSESGEENDEDDTAELMQELARIQQEREQQAKVEAERQAKFNEDTMLKSNPLLNQGANADFNIKKRWYDDTVFKNQTKTEAKQQKRFINDTIRNDFHKKFLFRFVQ